MQRNRGLARAGEEKVLGTWERHGLHPNELQQLPARAHGNANNPVGDEA
jgi:hypothetical protein